MGGSGRFALPGRRAWLHRLNGERRDVGDASLDLLHQPQSPANLPEHLLRVQGNAALPRQRAGKGRARLAVGVAAGDLLGPSAPLHLEPLDGEAAADATGRTDAQLQTLLGEPVCERRDCGLRGT